MGIAPELEAEVERLTKHCEELAKVALGNGQELIARERVMSNTAALLVKIADDIQEAYRYQGGRAYSDDLRSIAATLLETPPPPTKVSF